MKTTKNNLLTAQDYIKVWHSKRVQENQKTWLWGIKGIQTDGNSVYYKNMECGQDDLNESLWELFEQDVIIKGLSYDEQWDAFAGWCNKHQGQVKEDIEMFWDAWNENNGEGFEY